jgi:Mg-chelatase subunit ChlD
MNNDDIRGTRATQRFTQARGGDLLPYRRTSVRDAYLEGEIVEHRRSAFNLVIDSSGSMRGKEAFLASSLTETCQGLAMTLPDVDVTLTMFNNSISSTTFKAKNLRPFSASTLSAAFCGGTRLNDALADALSKAGNPEDVKTAVLVFTDGGEVSSTMKGDQLAYLVKAALEKGVGITVVGVFKSSAEEQVVKEWASRIGLPFGAVATFVADSPEATMRATSVGMRNATSALIRHIQQQ